MTGLPTVAIFRSPVFNRSETFIRAQAASLSRYRPLIVGLEDKGNVPAALAERVLLAEGTATRLAIKLIGRWGALADRVRTQTPVLIHAHFGPDGLLALPLARVLGVPLVTTLHGYDIGRAPRDMLLSGRLSWQRYALLRRRLMREGALFIAVSDALRARAIAQGYPAERTVTHRIGVDLARFRPGGAAEPGLVLHVGRLVEKKGTMLLLEAFAKVRTKRPDASLVIIGDGPLLPALKRRAGESVRFLGAQPPEAVAEWMARAWLLAAPSLTARDGDSEGLPTVAVEAAASGLPVIGSDHSGMPEAVRDGATGFIVPEGEAEPLASAIANLLGGAESRARMSEAARSLAQKEFDLARQTRLLEELYDRARGV